MPAGGTGSCIVRHEGGPGLSFLDNPRLSTGIFITGDITVLTHPSTGFRQGDNDAIAISQDQRDAKYRFQVRPDRLAGRAGLRQGKSPTGNNPLKGVVIPRGNPQKMMPLSIAQFILQGHCIDLPFRKQPEDPLCRFFFSCNRGLLKKKAFII